MAHNAAYSRAEVSALARCPVLVERDDELRPLSAIASEVAQGGGRAVVITGEASTASSRSLPASFGARDRAGWAAPRSRGADRLSPATG